MRIDIDVKLDFKVQHTLSHTAQDCMESNIQCCALTLTLNHTSALTNHVVHRMSSSAQSVVLCAGTVPPSRVAALHCFLFHALIGETSHHSSS